MDQALSRANIEDVIDSARRRGITLRYESPLNGVAVYVPKNLPTIDNEICSYLLSLIASNPSLVSDILKDDIYINLQFNGLAHIQIGMSRHLDDTEFLCAIKTLR